MDSDQASYYEAGSGRVLSHFASLVTPDFAKKKKSDWQCRSFDSTSSTGPCSVGQCKQVKVFDDFVLDTRTESSDHSSDMSGETMKSYALSLSPPCLSLKKLRKDTSTAAQLLTADRPTLSSSIGISYRKEDPDEDIEDEDMYSPVASSVKFLMSRDPDEEERVFNLKSDRDKVFLYKKRYTDTYVHAVALLKHAASLERKQADKQSDLEYLRATVQTQTQIITTLSENQQLSKPTGYQHEKKIQALCREVTGLVMQLSQRDSLIDSLHEEQDKSAKVINELKMSKGLSSTRVNEVVHYTDDMRDKLEDALREKEEAVEKESQVKAQLKDLQLLYNKCEAARSALSDGLDQAEKQTAALHAQWIQEKREMLASVQEEHQRSAKLAAECKRLRKDNETAKVADNSLAHIAQLQSELNELRPQLREQSTKQAKISALEKDLYDTGEKLRHCMIRVNELEKRLAQREKEVQVANTHFLERATLLEQRVFDAEAVRRRLHNKVMELKGNIRVFCRVRPVLRHELASSRGEEIFAFPDYRTERRQIELSANPKSHIGYGQNGSRNAVKKYTFDFDLVFDSKCSQEDIFLEVSALIQSALDGYNVCVFAYGQTGSGKTYTMQGKESSDAKSIALSRDTGIVGRAISYIFAGINELKSSGWDFVTSLELVEIYNETLRDLLAPADSTDKVDLRLDSDGRVNVVNSCVCKVQNDQEAWSLLRGALSKRLTKSTRMNDRSSRSHCVITFRLSGENVLTRDRRTGIVNLVDLAGSERLSKLGSDSNKELLKETTSINKSLSALGNVICALAKKSTHVPFRDSKLTHFLSSSLGGDSKTLMICNLSPLSDHRDETLNSLRFAKMVNSCEMTYPSLVSVRS